MRADDAPVIEQGAARSLRLFFALWPPAAVAAHLERAAMAVQRSCGGRRPRRENLHLTLAFLGEVAPSRLDVLLQLGDELRGQPQTLWVDQLGYWKHNRILYAGCGVVPGELAEFAERLSASLAAAGYRVERRPFAAHLTLLRDVRPTQALPQLAPVEWRIDRFSLVASTLHAGGPRYKSLRVWMW